MNKLINETLYSGISHLIPNNIKSYFTMLVNYTNSNYFNTTLILDSDRIKLNFYVNFYKDLKLSYKPLLKKYPCLINNYLNLEKFLLSKI